MSLAEPIAPPTVALLLDALSTCVCEQLATTGAGPVCWCGIYPGNQVSFEFCGECGGNACGMGWVRLAGAFPTDPFPNPTLDPSCFHPVAWTIEVGALRCIPTPPDGMLPGPDVLALVGLDQALDANALYNAIQCCGLDRGTWVVQNWLPLGPDGGCVGGAWTVFVGE